MDEQPTIIVLAGANGAGNTTAARSLLVDLLNVVTFVNADEIARGLSPFDPESMAIPAGRLMLGRLDQLATARDSFAFETTLSGRMYVARLQRWRDAGYFIRLIYFWLDSPELNVARVAQRVRQGGHKVPEDTIRQRYERSAKNFLHRYRQFVDAWSVYDNSVADKGPSLVAAGDIAGVVNVSDQPRWRKFQEPLTR